MKAKYHIRHVHMFCRPPRQKDLLDYINILPKIEAKQVLKEHHDGFSLQVRHDTSGWDHAFLAKSKGVVLYVPVSKEPQTAFVSGLLVMIDSVID